MHDRDTLALVEKDGPEVGELQRAYKEDLAELGQYFHQVRRGYENRRNIWAGKTEDLRKHGANPFPWEGASDVEAPVIDEIIKTYVAIASNALKRSNLRAYPTETGDAAQARLVSAFIKWMIRSYIPGFSRQNERGVNYLFEKGLIVSYIGWEKKSISGLQRFNMEQISRMSPELADMIQSGGEDEGILAMLQSVFPKLTRKRGLKAIRELRTKGETVITVSTKTIDRPIVETLAPDSEVFWPAWCLDPQKAPRVSRRAFLTEQELLNRVESEGWDKGWVDHVIEHHRGVDSYQIEQGAGLAERTTLVSTKTEESDLYEIVYMYRRLIDTEDGSEGIYCTVFHPDTEGFPGTQEYAKHELLDQMSDYPFEVTRLSEDHKRMYDLQTFPDILRSAQWQVKVERDSRIDSASMDTLPPLMGPAGRRPDQWRPGGYVPRRRADEYSYAPKPGGGLKSREVEETLLKQAKFLVGLDPEDPDAPVKKQFYVDKILEHVQKVVGRAFGNWRMYGPDQVFFRVTGYPDQMQLDKGRISEEFDINISFDVLNNDPEALERKFGALVQALGLDRNGKYDLDAFLELYAYSVDPILADAIVQPSGQAQEQMVGKVLEDITKIAAGIEVGAQPQGASVAMQVIRAYTSQPDIQERLQSEKEFAERLGKYAQQYEMQLAQQQNAVVGKLGTAPAMFQGANVQPG